jgi:hypothetical protein
MANYANTTPRQRAHEVGTPPELQTLHLPSQSTTIYAKIVNVWRASPPPRPWVVALGFILIATMVLVQTYEAGREAGFQLAELAR